MPEKCPEFISKFLVPPVDPKTSPQTCGLCAKYDGCTLPQKRKAGSNGRKFYDPNRKINTKSVQLMDNNQANRSLPPSAKKTNR